MSESFIDQVKNKYANPGTEYEDFLIAAELIHVKSMIEFAVKNGKNSVTWTYSYDSYDSYTIQIDDLYNGDPHNVKKYFEKPVNVNIFAYGGLADYLAKWKEGTYGRTPSAPKTINFEYIKRNLEKELYNLGCKSVQVNIGPKSYKYRRLVKKGNLFKSDTYEDVTATVTEWLISISW